MKDAEKIQRQEYQRGLDLLSEVYLRDDLTEIERDLHIMAAKKAFTGATVSIPAAYKALARLLLVNFNPEGSAYNPVLLTTANNHYRTFLDEVYGERYCQKSKGSALDVYASELVALARLTPESSLTVGLSFFLNALDFSSRFQKFITCYAACRAAKAECVSNGVRVLAHELLQRAFERNCPLAWCARFFELFAAGGILPRDKKIEFIDAFHTATFVNNAVGMHPFPFPESRRFLGFLYASGLVRESCGGVASDEMAIHCMSEYLWIATDERYCGHIAGDFSLLLSGLRGLRVLYPDQAVRDSFDALACCLIAREFEGLTSNVFLEPVFIEAIRPRLMHPDGELAATQWYFRALDHDAEFIESLIPKKIFDGERASEKDRLLCRF